MSYRVPRRRLLEGGVVDPVDYSEALRNANEALGALNGHNFKASEAQTLLPSDDTEYVTGALANTESAGNFTKERLAAAYEDVMTSTFNQSNHDALLNARTWQKVPGTDWAGYTDAGRLRLQLSVQSTQFSLIVSTGTGRQDVQPVSVKWGIFLDDALVVDSVIGGLDLGWEPANMEQGVGHFTTRVNPEVTVPVAAGNHTAYGVVWIEPLEGDNLGDVDAVASVFSHYARLTAHLRAR